MKREKHKEPWHSVPRLKFRRIFTIALAWFALGAFLQHGWLGEQLDSRLGRHSDFAVRAKLGRAPRLSPRLKVFGVDNKTMAALGEEAISLGDWAMLLQTLAARKPRAILIDKAFGLALTKDRAELDRFLRIAHDSPPIFVGAMVSPQPIQGRVPLPADRPELRRPADWISPASEGLAYGPHPTLLSAFARVGHLNLLEHGHVEPLIPLGKELAIPHLSLLLAEKRESRRGRIFLDGRELPVDSRGRCLVDFSEPGEYLSSGYSLLHVFHRAWKHEPETLVQEGDIVLILTQLSHGEVAMEETPIGLIPSSFVTVSLVNSVLTGEWLKMERVDGTLLILAGSLLGAIVGSVFGTTLFLVTLLGGAALVCAAGLASFCFAGAPLPWPFTALFYTGSAVFAFVAKARAHEKKSRQLRLSLEGLVDPKKLDELLRNPSEARFTPSSQVLSVMFIDIAGFSLSASRHEPKILFTYLKDLMDRLTPIIHRAGGIVDKTMGDGLLCFFGYRYGSEGEAIDLSHAKSAFLCAREIQRQTLEWNREVESQGRPVYPLRIGLHTEEVFIGDIGGSGRIEFTIIGSGVNFAQRLEAACENHHVLISASCHDRLDELARDPGFARRWIKVKHFGELVEAWEFNPFLGRESELARAVDAFRKFIGIDRQEPRWSVDSPRQIVVKTSDGEAELVNFSLSGLGLRLPRYYGKGVTLQVALDSPDGRLGKSLEREGLSRIPVEIRWGRPDDSGFLHGVSIQLLSETQRTHLFQSLRQYGLRGAKAAA